MIEPGAMADYAWETALSEILHGGSSVAPRGQPVLELLGRQLVIDMLYPVVSNPARKLNYQFMVAEALWILRGSNNLEEIAQHNSRMREFSDDGRTLAGAYGPRFVAQLDYVAQCLARDRDTRQATMTLWNRVPEPSKDIPCTVALDFKIRDDALYCQVFMRSSDVWLGLPYDIFSFTMMAYRVIEHLHHRGVIGIRPGNLHVVAASSHLYEQHVDGAREVLHRIERLNTAPVPSVYHDPSARSAWVNGGSLIQCLTALLADKNLRWWGPHATVS